MYKRQAIRYSSHLRFAFFETKREKSNATKVTIFAPNYAKNSTALVTRSQSVFLEGAQKEAEILESLFPSKAFIGKTATKENFVNYKSEGNILHMAMHASIDKDNPGFSHFDFSNGEKLFLEELYALKIPADLAVLSACNTAVGKEDGSLSIRSLQRAFNYAGTTATIASLWEVPDEATSKIMIGFYEYLKDGKSKSKALQQAKIDYLNTTDITTLKHPYYWAGFILYGEDIPVVSQNMKSIWIVLQFILIIAVICLILFKRRKVKLIE